MFIISKIRNKKSSTQSESQCVITQRDCPMGEIKSSSTVELVKKSMNCYNSCPSKPQFVEMNLSSKVT